MCTM